MKLTDLFIRRPILAIVVNLVILIAGLQAARSLNVRQYPRNENAAITITTVYVGANAELVRGFITTPLEREKFKIQLAKLESELGGPLFERGRRAARLTALRGVAIARWPRSAPR